MAITFEEELIRVEFVIGEDTVSETVTGQITVPATKPDVERVIDVRANLTDIVANIEDGVVNITGKIDVGVIYVADVEEPYFRQPVHFTEGQIPLVNSVGIPEAEPGMNVFTDINIRRVSFQRIDPRTIEITVVLTKFVKVTEYRQITVITDITGIPEENITEELLRIEDVIGENTITTVIEGRVTRPNEKPPIERILSVTPEIMNVTTEISEEGVVVVDGQIFAGVMYVADVPPEEFQQPVHFMEGSFPFSEVIDVPGAEPGMTVHVNLTIKRVSFEFIDEDTVEVNVVVQFFVKVTEPKQVTVVVDVISDLVEVERELLRVEDVVGEATVHETVSGRINIPPGKPDVERIIEANARVIGYTATTEEGGVLITADPRLAELAEGEVPEEGIAASVLYVADVEEPYLLQPVHFVEGFFGFENFIDIAGTEPGMNVHTEVTVTRASAEIINERTLEVTTVLRKFAKVTEFRQMEIVIDIVIISPVVEDECPPSYIVYVIQPGDTLWKIARRYCTTIDALLRANPNIDPNNLQIGQKICVPRRIIDAKG